MTPIALRLLLPWILAATALLAVLAYRATRSSSAWRRLRANVRLGGFDPDWLSVDGRRWGPVDTPYRYRNLLRVGRWRIGTLSMTERPEDLPAYRVVAYSIVHLAFLVTRRWSPTWLVWRALFAARQWLDRCAYTLVGLGLLGSPALSDRPVRWARPMVRLWSTFSLNPLTIAHRRYTWRRGWVPRRDVPLRLLQETGWPAWYGLLARLWGWGLIDAQYDLLTISDRPTGFSLSPATVRRRRADRRGRPYFLRPRFS